MTHPLLRPAVWLGAVKPLSLAPLAPTAVAEETATAVRVVARDAGGDLTVIDPEPRGGETVGLFSTPNDGYAYLYPSGNGRYVLANHFDGRHVTILDIGRTP